MQYFLANYKYDSSQRKNEKFLGTGLCVIIISAAVDALTEHMKRDACH
jgi:hypothetical protein